MKRVSLRSNRPRSKLLRRQYDFQTFPAKNKKVAPDWSANGALIDRASCALRLPGTVSGVSTRRESHKMAGNPPNEPALAHYARLSTPSRMCVVGQRGLFCKFVKVSRSSVGFSIVVSSQRVRPSHA